MPLAKCVTRDLTFGAADGVSSHEGGHVLAVAGRGADWASQPDAVEVEVLVGVPVEAALKPNGVSISADACRVAQSRRNGKDLWCGCE